MILILTTSPNLTRLYQTHPILIATFVYDGDGKQVKSTVNGVTTLFVGVHYHVEDGVVSKYYLAGASRIAVRKNGTLSYLLSDHLGSTSITTDDSGNLISELRYSAWGETRYSSGTTPTNYRYTGQREESDFGLYFYNARFYDPALGRFAQADTIIPGGVQGLDRYAAMNNNPVKYTDPSGHYVCGSLAYCEPPDRSVELTEKGTQIRDLYLHVNQEKGYDQYEFAAWILAIEASGLKDDLYNLQTNIGSLRLWRDHVDVWGHTDPQYAASCPKSPCFNGVFNFLGSYMESGWGRYSIFIDGDDARLFQLPTNTSASELEQMIGTGSSTLSVPNWGTYGNDVPIHFGYYDEDDPRLSNSKWIGEIMNTSFTLGNQWNQVAYLYHYERVTSVVLTMNQFNYWKKR